MPKSRQSEACIAALRYLIDTISSVFAAYFKGQGLVVLILCALYALALGLIGIKFGVLIGLVTGLLSVIPYLGFIIGIVVSLIVAAIQSIYAISNGAELTLSSFSQLFWVILAFAVIQLLEGFVITPRVMGKSIGIGFVPTMILLMLGGMAFGPLGMVVSIPLAAVLLKIYKDKLKKA